MKVLLAASEVAPIIKLGGLGDVAGSLPKALAKIDVDIDVIAPYFPFAKTEGLPLFKNIEINVAYAGDNHVVEVWKTKLPGSDVDVILLKNDEYFAGYGGRGKTNYTEIDIFSFYDTAVVAYIKAKFNTYDLIHCNDWHTGMIVGLLSIELGLERPSSLFTIHNLMYQGISVSDLLQKFGIVPGAHPLIDYDIADGDLNFMQQGLTSSDFLNTVSPSYAQEILDGLYKIEVAEIIKSREGRFCGILNGIDYSQFPREYDENNVFEYRATVKKDLLNRLGLDSSKDKPLFGFVGRLDPNQKGIDILFDVIKDLVKKGGQFVLLGSGDTEWEEKLNKLSQDKTLHDNISINTKFDLDLATLIYSGSDFLVVPSKYEPCGLIQMIAMWYGSLPVVNDTGGLKDSVIHGKTGVKFSEYSSNSLMGAIEYAISIYGSDQMKSMIKSAMLADFSWERSAIEYKKLYERILKLREDSKF